MVVTNERSNFVVQQEIWAPENEQTVRYIALAMSCLDKTRILHFSFEQPPVLNGEGGTFGPRPTCRIQFEGTHLNSYRESIQRERTQPQMSHLISSLNSFNTRCTRVFYEKIPLFTSIFIDVKDHLTQEEQALLDANSPLSVEDFTPMTEGFYLLSDAFTYSSSDLNRKFEVQNIFWAKPDFVNIAKKIAKFITSLDGRGSLFFPFTGEEGIESADMPTFLMSREFIDLNDYKNRIETELNTPSLVEAVKLLAICCKTQTRQFWKHQLN